MGSVRKITYYLSMGSVRKITYYLCGPPVLAVSPGGHRTASVGFSVYELGY